MFNKSPSLMQRMRAAARAVAVFATVCLQGGMAQAQTASAPQGSGRIWFYREYEPYVSRNYATVMLNGVVAGSVQPYGGAIYRDIAPGHYHATVESFGSDVNQAADVDLAPSQEVYLKILNAPNWASGGLNGFQRDTYYLRLIPPDIARAEIARRPF
jgi:hypothetical protein